MSIFRFEDYAKQETCVKAGRASFLLGIFFDPEVGCDMFLRNIDRLSADYTKLNPRRQNFSMCSLS
jgi:hypothetical protein